MSTACEQSRRGHTADAGETEGRDHTAREQGTGRNRAAGRTETGWTSKRGPRKAGQQR